MRNQSNGVSDVVTCIRPRKGVGVVVGLIVVTMCVVPRSPLRAQTTVSGDVVSDAVWSPAGNPWLVSGSIRIRSGATLTVQPGTVVRFGTLGMLSVGSLGPLGSGRLIASGAVGNPITFTADTTAPTPGAWRRIEFSSGTLDGSTMNNCVVEYGGGATASSIRIVGGNPTLTNVLIRDAAGDGLAVAGGAPTVSSMSVADVAGRGVVISGGDASITGMSISSPGGAGIEIAGTPGPSTTIVNSTVERGIEFLVDADTPAPTGCTFVQYDAFPSRIPARLVGDFLVTNTFQGVTQNVSTLNVRGGTVASSTTWPDIGLVYRVLGDVTIAGDLSPVLTVDAGVQMRFVVGGLRVGAGSAASGRLVVSGTTMNPVSLSGDAPGPGSWSGVAFRSADGVSSLTSCVIENGGAGSDDAGLFVENSQVALVGCTVTGSDGDGIRTVSSSISVVDSIVSSNTDVGLWATGTIGPSDVSGTSFSGNGSWPLRLRLGVMSTSFAANTFSGNGIDAIALDGGDVDIDVGLSDLGVPYDVLSDITINGTRGDETVVVTVDPGVEMKFDAGCELRVGSGSDRRGVLVAQGTPSAPIVFGSSPSSPAPGDWDGIRISTTTPACVVSHAIVEHAGGGINDAGIRIESSFPRIEHAIVRWSSTNGIRVDGGTPSIRRSSIVGNQVGLRIDAASPEAVAVHNTIEGNTVGCEANPFVSFNVRGNWWGSPSGPAIDGTGTGDSIVGSNLTFVPWLSESPSPVLAWKRLDISNQVVASGGGRTTISGALTLPADWTLAVHDSADVLVQSLVGSGTDVLARWDGTDGGGNQVPNGNYSLTLTATSAATADSASQARALVDVSGGVPSAEITSPVSGATIPAGLVVISGTAAGSDFAGYVLEREAANGVWVSITQGSVPVVDGLLGSFDSSVIASAGYRLRLRVQAGLGSDGVTTVDVRHLRMTSPMASPAVFSPNNDGVFDFVVVTATASIPVEHSIEVRAQGTLVRSFTSPGPPLSVAWDGRDESGVTVPDGSYDVIVTATETDTGASVVDGFVGLMVDGTPPIATIDAPSSGTTIATDTPFVVSGSATDSNFSMYRVLYAPANSSTPFAVLETVGASVLNGTLATVDPTTLGNGAFVLRLEVTDAAGNISTDDHVVTLDYVDVANVSRNPVVFDPWIGETTTLSFSVGTAVDDVEVDIYRFATGVKVRELSTGPLANGAHVVTWDGCDGGGTIVDDGIYYFVIEASASNGRSGTWNDAVSPQLGSAPDLNQVVTDTEGFIPHRNDMATVSYQVSTFGRVSIGVTDDVGSIIRPLASLAPRVPGTTYIERWDGRVDAGSFYFGVFGFLFLPVAPAPLEGIVVQASTPRIDGLRTESYAIKPVFSEVTRMTYGLTRASFVTISIIDPNGSHVRTLATDDPQGVGSHAIEWDGKDDAGCVVDVEGDYRVVVDARDQVTNTVGRRVGALAVFRP